MEETGSETDKDAGDQNEYEYFHVFSCEYIVNASTKKPLPAWLPFVIGALLVAQFAGLGVWQISRGLEKQATRDELSGGGSYSNFQHGDEVRSYQRIRATGRMDSERQILLDNIILDSRYGYYVVTPLELDPDDPLLLVNRGWIGKDSPNVDKVALAEQIAVGDESISLRGRVGSLPRPGMRMGEPFADNMSWPKIAVFPTIDSVALALGRDVENFVLLLDPEESGGFLRHWVPSEMGPSKHYGYAFQWFAMAAVLSGLLVWHGRRRRNRKTEDS